MKWLTFGALCGIIATTGGCVQVGPKSLDSSCPKLTVPPAPQCPQLQAAQCPRLELPGIAETVTIRIRGSQVEADAGGEALIRNYSRAQQLLR